MMMMMLDDDDDQKNHHPSPKMMAFFFPSPSSLGQFSQLLKKKQKNFQYVELPTTLNLF
jgi:hypothetical protein